MLDKAKYALGSNSPYIVEASHVRKVYDANRVRITALDDLSVQITPGEVVAIMGPSGCGKTTLLNCLSGLDGVDGGVVKIAGHDLTQLSDEALTAFRARQMGFVFQTYNLLPVLTGRENVELPLLMSGVRTRDARCRADEAITQVGLIDWANHKPAEMSGGQRQRFTLARALATRPAIVWADEPTGALDSATSHEIIDLMLQLNRQYGQTFVWVTHAAEVAEQSQRLITMCDGRIVTDHAVTPSTSVTAG